MLEEPLLQVCPAIRPLMETGSELAGRPVRVSGSGSTLFTAFDTRDEADEFAQRVRERLGIGTRRGPVEQPRAARRGLRRLAGRRRQGRPAGERYLGRFPHLTDILKEAEMEITEVRVKLVEKSKERLRAFCSITFDGAFVVRDLKVIGSGNRRRCLRGHALAETLRSLPAMQGQEPPAGQFCNDCGRSWAISGFPRILTAGRRSMPTSPTRSTPNAAR